MGIIIRRELALASCALGLLGLSACAMPADEGSEDELDTTDPSGQPGEQAVWQGAQSDEPTVIGLSALNTDSFSCSGSALSDRVIVTSAHCLPPNSTTCGGVACSTGTMRIFHSNGPGKRASTVRNVQAFRHESFAHDLDVENDIAVVVLDRANAMLSPVLLNLSGVSEGSLLWAVAGWGTTSQYDWVETGIQHAPTGDRNFGVDWATSSYFIDDNDSDVRLCRGDSGSPAYRLDTSLPGNPFSIAGVHEGSDRTQGRLCAVGGAKQRWTSVLPKVSWLESRIRASGHPCVGSGAECCARVGGSAQCF